MDMPSNYDFRQPQTCVQVETATPSTETHHKLDQAERDSDYNKSKVLSPDYDLGEGMNSEVE